MCTCTCHILSIQALTCRFKHVFSEIFPLCSFLDVSTPPPTHPFVVLSILSHVEDSLLPICDVDLLVDESILYCMAGGGCAEAMLALFILSHSPWSQRNAEHVPANVMRVISLAHSIGVDLGLDRIAESVLRRAEHATEEQLEKVLLVSYSTPVSLI